MLTLVPPMTKQNRQNRLRRRPQRRTNISGSPPSFNSSVRFSKRVRFSNTSGSTVAFTIFRHSLLSMFCMGVTDSVAYRTLNAVRLRRIEVWALSGFGTSSSSDNATGTISVMWQSNYSPEAIISDTGTVFRPAHLMTRPPKDSLASYWSLGGINESEPLFSLQLPQQTIFDLIVDCVVQNNALNDQTPISVTPTTGGSLVDGRMYIPYLDGPSSGAGLAPTDYPSFS